MRRDFCTSDTFTDDEIQAIKDVDRTPHETIIALSELGERIAADLACNCNGDGLPCLTCRREAERNMARYLRLATCPAPSAVEPR